MGGSETEYPSAKWVGIGLLATGIAGISAGLAGRPFLSALSLDFDLPLAGHVHLSSVLLFDLGVYMVVVGVAVLILVALGHQSLRFRRKTVIPPSAEFPGGAS